jgi:hypothetical protein
VGDPRIGKWKDAEIARRVADNQLEILLVAGIEMFLGRLQIDHRVQILREMPGVAVDPLRFPLDPRRDDADAPRFSVRRRSWPRGLTRCRGGDLRGGPQKCARAYGSSLRNASQHPFTSILRHAVFLVACDSGNVPMKPLERKGI